MALLEYFVSAIGCLLPKLYLKVSIFFLNNETSFITKLKPVTYQLDLDVIHTYLKTPSEVRKPETENDKKQEIQTGFIAQEVEAVLPAAAQ